MSTDLRAPSAWSESDGELRRRGAILDAVRAAADRFLAEGVTWECAIDGVLADLGRAAEVSRVVLSENVVGTDGELWGRRLNEWDADGVTPSQDNPEAADSSYGAGRFDRWRRTLGAGQVLAGSVRELPPAENALLGSQDVKSIAAVPVFVGSGWWGTLGFHECRTERTWSVEELAALRTAASTIGVAIRQQRLQEQIRERELQYRHVFEAATDGLGVCDLDGVLVEANPAFHAMHGYEPGELVGRHMSTWTQPSEADAVTARVATAAASGTISMHAEHVRKDGSLLPVEIRGTVLRVRGAQHLLAEVRDVSERIEMMQLLERRVSALAKVAASLVVDQPLAALLGQLAGITVAAGCGVAAAVQIVDVRSGDLTMAVTHGLPDGYERGLMESWRAGVQSPTATALREQRVRLVRDAPAAALANPRYAPLHALLKDVAWENILVLPLDSLGRCFGSLNVYYPAGTEPEPDEITFMSAMANQAALAVENARLLDEGRARAADLERQRLARDLHDSVSQALFSMTLHARTAQLAMAKDGLPDSGPLARAVQQLRDLTQGALAEMRALIFELRPGALAEEGLVAALGKQAAALTAREDLPITVSGPESRLGLREDVEQHAYRIVLEALHNTVKHANARRASVVVGIGAGGLQVTVSDDGDGFDPAVARPGHLGLTTMTQRADSIGATLRIDSAPGSGTTMTLRLPLPGRTATASSEGIR